MYHLQVYEKAKGEEITAKMVMKELKKKYSDTDVTEVFGKDNDEYDILRIVSTIIEHQQNTVNVYTCIWHVQYLAENSFLTRLSGFELAYS